MIPEAPSTRSPHWQHSAEKLHGRGSVGAAGGGRSLSASVSCLLPLPAPQLVLLQKLQGVSAPATFAKTPMSVRRLAIGSVVPWEVHPASRRSATHESECSVL